MLTIIKKMGKIKKILTKVVMIWLLFVDHAFAKLPKLIDSSQGKSIGILGNIRAYIYDGIVIGGLILTIIALIVATRKILIEYNNTCRGEGTWAKFWAWVVSGIILVVVCAWLAILVTELLMN